MDEVIKLALQESNDIESHYGHKVNGHKDLLNSLLAWKFLCDRELNLSIEDVKTAHWLITHQQLPIDERGTLRSSNGIEVTIGGRNGLSSRLVQDAMYQWLSDMQFKMSPKEAHIRFEKIHPFVDGNGRTGRLIYYWQLKQLGELSTGSVIFDEDREDYYQWFR
jgi:Fic family protein